MGKNYDQLDIDERYEIYRFHEAGKSRGEIGRLMGRSASTIGGELHRNSLPMAAKSRRQRAGAPCPAGAGRQGSSALVCCGPLSAIALRWGGRRSRSLAGAGSKDQSTPSTTRHSTASSTGRARGPRICIGCRQEPRRRGGGATSNDDANRFPDVAPFTIAQRPFKAVTPSDIGKATSCGSARSGGNLVTLRERKTRFTLAAPSKSKTAEETGTMLRTILGYPTRPATWPITFDNGSEFTLHSNLTQSLAFERFFCDPHSPRQRGTIENTNGFFRRDMPSKTRTSNCTARDIDELAWAINSTPRKPFGFRTPADASLESLQRCT